MEWIFPLKELTHNRADKDKGWNGERRARNTAKPQTCDQRNQRNEWTNIYGFRHDFWNDNIIFKLLNQDIEQNNRDSHCRRHCEKSDNNRRNCGDCWPNVWYCFKQSCKNGKWKRVLHTENPQANVRHSSDHEHEKKFAAYPSTELQFESVNEMLRPFFWFNFPKQPNDIHMEFVAFDEQIIRKNEERKHNKYSGECAKHCSNDRWNRCSNARCNVVIILDCFLQLRKLERF